MNGDVAEVTDGRKSPETLAQLLVRLFDERFGGASGGRFRVSRKFLRKLAGRRKLSDAFLADLAEEVFEAGFVFVDCESYAIVLSQKQFASYRRVTAAAAYKVMSHEEANDEPDRRGGQEDSPPEVPDSGQGTGLRETDLH